MHSNYFKQGFQQLKENIPSLENVSEKIATFLKDYDEKTPDFSHVLKDADKLMKAFDSYNQVLNLSEIEKTNFEQKNLAETIKPFFGKLHELLKDVDKKFRHIEKDQNKNKDVKVLKTELEELHKEAKSTEYFFAHINWLQERFPEAKYEDVTGLCKLATPEEVKEQEYSLNSGRYVGVVIEEDGKTEKEFIEEMLSLNDELEKLNSEARELESIISHNIKQISGE